MSDPALIEAVWDHRVVDHVSSTTVGDPEVARAARRACRQIGAELERHVDRWQPILEASGVRIIGLEPVADRQNHTITWLVPDVASAELGAAVLGRHGFETWEQWDGAALRSFRRSADQITAARTDDDTTLVVRFRWRARRRHGLVARVLTPTSGDWSMIRLPSWAWPGYSIVRICRLIAERLGLRRRHAASLGPFLATPDALLEPLFDVADVGPDDVIVDLGAGDGRIAIAAAHGRGCRAIGVEQDPGLVERARERADDAGVGDRVTFTCGDARDVDLDTATVVFMFLPIDVAAELLPQVRARLSDGARVVIHEQTRPPDSLVPDESRVVTGHNAVSVAHLWRAGTR